MNKIILITITYLSLALNGFAQPGNGCYAKIGSNYYLNCKHIITFDGQDVFTIKNSVESEILINFDVFSEKGEKIASVASSKMVAGETELFTLKSTDSDFSFVEKSSKELFVLSKRFIMKKLRSVSYMFGLICICPRDFTFSALQRLPMYHH